MEINQIRRQNLTRVVNEFSSNEAAAKRAGVSGQYLGALLVPGKAFGERSARRLEVAFGLKPGDLDRDLIGGSGGSTDDETIRLAKRFQALSTRDRAAVSALVDRLLAA